MSKALIENALVDELGYSLRRAFIDQFFFEIAPEWEAESRLLDLGGHKVKKRGRFDLAAYPLRATYVNLTTAKQPDVQADASLLPFGDGLFDVVICAELLEHVPQPLEVLAEAHRVLKAGGELVITVPFLVPIHGDPYDYGRYTPTFWQENLNNLGFEVIQLNKQGLYWSVLAEMLRAWAYERAKQRRPRPLWLRRLMVALINRARRFALARDSRSSYQKDPFYSNFTTGFSIRCRKKAD